MGMSSLPEEERTALVTRLIFFTPSRYARQIRIAETTTAGRMRPGPWFIDSPAMRHRLELACFQIFRHSQTNQVYIEQGPLA